MRLESTRFVRRVDLSRALELALCPPVPGTVPARCDVSQPITRGAGALSIAPFPPLGEQRSVELARGRELVVRAHRGHLPAVEHDVERRREQVRRVRDDDAGAPSSSPDPVDIRSMLPSSRSSRS